MMVTNHTRSKLGQTANVNVLVVVNDELVITEIEQCCPLGKSDHQVLKNGMQLDCLFNLSTSSKIVFVSSKADLDVLRDHFSDYNDWTLLIWI